MLRRQLTFLAWPLLAVPQCLLWTGTLFNQIAMVANDGLMPVLWNSGNKWTEDLYPNGHSIMTHGTHLKFLCDWINLHIVVMSVGDVLIDLSDLTMAPAFWIWVAYVLYRAYQSEIL